MAELKLSGMLKLTGTLAFNPQGGVLKIGHKKALVEGATGNANLPVLIPPPPSAPSDGGLGVEVVKSFNQGVTTDGTYVVAGGVVKQGNQQSWPGMMLPGASQVMINGLPANVAGEMAAIFPSGGAATMSNSGQK